jgi:hypothetical protein
MMNEEYLVMQQIENQVKMAIQPLNKKIESLQADLEVLRGQVSQARQHAIMAAAPVPVQPVQQQAPSGSQFAYQQAPSMSPQSPQPQYAQQGYAQAPQQAQYAPQGYPQEAPKKPLDQPIDRNGIAPSSISIEKFFYAGGKR